MSFAIVMWESEMSAFYLFIILFVCMLLLLLILFCSSFEVSSVEFMASICSCQFLSALSNLLACFGVVSFLIQCL